MVQSRSLVLFCKKSGEQGGKPSHIDMGIGIDSRGLI